MSVDPSKSASGSKLRPGDSPEEQRWFRRIQENLRHRLFASTSGDSHANKCTERPATSQTLPTRIGRYLIIKRIGVGGMGMVYAAYDDTLDRKVAVKLLRADSFGADQGGRPRLVREAQALARLSHPSIIHVYEVGVYNDQVYLAMEYVDGVTLKSWQAVRGWKEVLNAYQAAGRGLATAHAAGIVHRDFKPENVLVRRDGRVRVLDFGLARTDARPTADRVPPESPEVVEQAEPEPQPEPRVDSARVAVSDTLPADPARSEDPDPGALTRTGAIMGTPAYMAPEQHLGLSTDHRTDQFAFCISVYEGLYGYRPFAGNTLEQLRTHVLGGQVEAPPNYPRVPAKLHRAIIRGLSVDPTARYESMTELLEELQAASTRTLSRLLLVAIAVVMVIVVSGWWWIARENQDARLRGEEIRARFERARTTDTEDELRRLKARTVSELWDDLVLTYANAQVDHEPSLALAALKHLTPHNRGWLTAARTIAADAEIQGVFYRELRHDPELGEPIALDFLWDNSAVAIAYSSGALQLWENESGEVRVAPAVQFTPAAIAFAPSFDTLAAAGTDGSVWLWDTAKNSMRRLTVAETRLRCIDWAPDGSHLALGGQDGRVRLVHIDGTITRNIEAHNSEVADIQYSDDGTTLATTSINSSKVWFLERRTHWDLRGSHGVTGVRFSDNDRLLTGVDASGAVRHWNTENGIPTGAWTEQDVDAFTTDASGTVALIKRRTGELVVRDIHWQEAQPLGTSKGVRTFTVSANAQWAAETTHNGTRLWQIGNTEQGRRWGGPAVLPVPDGSSIRAVAFSADGGALATGSSNGAIRLWNGDVLTPYEPVPDTPEALSFAPDSRHLAVVTANGTLHAYDLATGRRRRLRQAATHGLGELAWSARGEYLASYACVQPYGECGIAVYPVDGSTPWVLRAPRPRLMRLSGDGRTLLSDHPAGVQLWDVSERSGDEISLLGDGDSDQRLGAVFVGSNAVRIATLNERASPTGELRHTLRVWHVSTQTKRPHLLFTESDLREIRPSADHRILLLTTADNRTLVWNLGQDYFSRLPANPGAFDRFLATPDGSAILLYGPRGESRLVDVETGLIRRFPDLHPPIALSSQGTVADVGQGFALRQWLDPTPDQPSAFLTWLRNTTAVTVDVAQLR